MGTLRFLLALSVIFAHTGPLYGYKLVGDYVAVQSFFIISGFYMALILNEKYRGPGSFRLFISNRILRLYPLYWVVLALVVLQAWLLPTHGAWPANPFAAVAENAGQLSFVQYLVLAMTNLGVVGLDWLVFCRADAAGAWHLSTTGLEASTPLWHYIFIPQAWSVGLELGFYLVAPLLVRRRWQVVAAVIGISLALRMFIYYGLHLNREPFTYHFFPNEIALFLAGALSYRMYRANFLTRLAPRLQGMLVALFFIATATYTWWPRGFFQRWFYYAAVVMMIPVLFTLTKSRPVDRYIGELSYPMYICHLLVLALLQSWLPVQDAPATVIAVSVGTIVLSAALMRFVQDPIERIRARRVKAFRVDHPQPAAST